jgi:glutaredoxin 3
VVRLIKTSTPEVRIYTRRWCGYCFAARRMLTKLKIDFEEIPLDRDPELRRSLSEANNHWSTVPMIFIGDHFVGGFTDLARIHRKGQLETLLEGTT